MKISKYDYNKLAGRIREICITRVEFAKKVNLSEASVSNKLTGKNPFTQPEIDRIAKVLKIPNDELYIYFFKEKV